MEIEYIKDPVYVDETRINCRLKWVGIAEEFPFTADANDVEPHGREIYAALIAGNYGPIAPSAP